MTATLILRLEGPLQSWGHESRFTRRGTAEQPTKSGVIGMIAAAQGRRRTDPVEDLVQLRYGVRTDQPGRLVRDFQTEIDWRTGKSSPLTDRHYLADAKFVVGLEGPRTLVDGIAEYLRSPRFPLYLGRRSCPPMGRMVAGVVDAPLESALRDWDWIAAPRYQRQQPAVAQLAVARDARPDETTEATAHDVPISFDQRNRRYDWRPIVLDWVAMPNPGSTSPVGHDPLALTGGA